ncbi:hypothetical protein [Streptomyces sp. NPDC001880]
MVVPETVVVDRGKVFLSKAFTGACEALGIRVQAAPAFVGAGHERGHRA